MSKNHQTDDVLDFINSLPDSKSATPKPVGKEEKDEDFLEFLDELAQHETKLNAGTPQPKFEPKLKPSKLATKIENNEEDVKDDVKDDSTLDQKLQLTLISEQTLEQPQDIEIDPIGSISNWWTTDGSSKVSSLWGTITSNAQNITEQTYQLASTTTNQLNQQRQKFLEETELPLLDESHVTNLSSRLNSLLTTMSNQIKQGLISHDDELLDLLVIYDMYNVDYIDQLAYNNFTRVMDQVEGGIRVSVANFNHNDQQQSNSNRVNLNMFHGKVIDGEKLCFANLESSIKDYGKISERVGEGKDEKELDEKIPEPTSVSNSESKVSSESRSSQSTESTDSSFSSDNLQINKSNVFISIQPITTKVEGATASDSGEEDRPILIEANNSDSFSFTIILKDITNNITIITKTQPFPLKWAKWLSGDILENKDLDADLVTESIDPSEWVKDWIRDGLNLSFGVVAQEYVIKRMGI